MTNKIIAIITVDEGRIYFDLEDMHDVYEQIEQATRTVYSFITRIGGNIVGQTRGDIICELDIDAAMQLKDLVEQIKEDLSKRCYIGIGEDTREASLALEAAKKDSITGIKVYDYNMDSKELSKAEKKLHSLEPEHKQKIAETIKVISQNKQILDQLKQEKPEIYDGISDLIRVMAMIITSDSMQKKDHLDKMAGTINDHLDKTHEKFKQAKSNEVEKILNQVQKTEGNIYVNHYSGSVCDIDNRNANDDESKSSSNQMQKSEMPKEVIQKVVSIIQNLENNKDVLEQIYNSNPELGEAFATIVSSMEQMMQEKGIHLESHLDQAHAESELNAPHTEQSKDYHNRKQVYPVGAVRQGSPGHERVKQPDGSWKTISGKPQ